MSRFQSALRQRSPVTVPAAHARHVVKRRAVPPALPRHTAPGMHTAEEEATVPRAQVVSPAGNTAPIHHALDQQLLHLERALALVAMAGCLIGAVLAGMSGRFVPGAPAAVAGILCVVLGLWFLGVWGLLGLGVGGRWMPWVNGCVETCAPTLFLLMDLYVKGADYCALDSAAVFGYGLVSLMAVMRLRPWMAVINSMLAAAQYLWITHHWVMPQVSDGLAASGAVDAGVVQLRALVLCLGGFLAAWVAFSLRRVMGQAHAAVRSNELFGKYRLLHQVASGGMGAVFRARYCPQGGFEREVAIKRIHPHLAKDGVMVDLFRQEAELCASLTHHNIVQVLDFGQEEDSYFLSMEFVDGMTLQDVLRRCRRAGVALPEHLVAFVARELCAGLDYAHARARDAHGGLLRVVHRDLSPSNVLLSAAGQVKITDFGIAKVLGTAAAAHTGTVMGKLAYMSPEQARRHPLDVRTDLYSVGLLVFEMLCNRQVFQGVADVADLVQRQSGQLPDVAMLRAGLDPDWSTFVMRALALDPDDRFQTALEMRTALDALVATTPTRSDELGACLASLG